jgi:hypothetical protein
LGFGFWVLGFGFWVLGFGFWVLGFGTWVFGFGCDGLVIGELAPHNLGIGFRVSGSMPMGEFVPHDGAEKNKLPDSVSWVCCPYFNMKTSYLGQAPALSSR